MRDVEAMTWTLYTDRAALWQGDCLELLQKLRANSVDALVTDPPAGIGFMNKGWDKDKGGRDAWVAWLAGVMREVLRVLKPGAHGLVWALPRTSHWTATALEDAGFEVRDVVMHVFGSGFPKSLDVSKAIDDKLGFDRPIVGPKIHGDGKPQHFTTEAAKSATAGRSQSGVTVHANATLPASPEAAQWDGWGTALKPAAEHWILVRKPLEGTVAANVLEYGTGGLNIGACRIGSDVVGGGGAAFGSSWLEGSGLAKGYEPRPVVGRFPANVLFSHSPDCVPDGTRVEKGHAGYPNGPGGNGFHGGVGREADGSRTEAHAPIPDREVIRYRCAPGCPVAQLDAQAGQSKSRKGKPRTSKAPGDGYGMTHTGAEYDDEGGPSRYFYVAKPSSRERDAGLAEAGIEPKSGGQITDREDGSAGLSSPRAGAGRMGGRRNPHPTVKPIELMRYLVRLITPPGGLVLDPFTGSGTTGIAALQEGAEFLGAEQSEEYAQIDRKSVV